MRKAVKLSIFLSFVSVCVTLIGIIDEWRHWDKVEGYVFFVLALFFWTLSLFMI